MIGSFRRLSKSMVGKLIMVVFFLLIITSFAMGDIANFRSGTFSFGGSALVEIGDQEIGDRDISRAMERRLADVRQQNPAADYSTIAADFEPLLTQLIDQRRFRRLPTNSASTCPSGWSMPKSPIFPTTTRARRQVQRVGLCHLPRPAAADRPGSPTPDLQARSCSACC